MGAVNPDRSSFLLLPNVDLFDATEAEAKYPDVVAMSHALLRELREPKGVEDTSEAGFSWVESYNLLFAEEGSYALAGFRGEHGHRGVLEGAALALGFTED